MCLIWHTRIHLARGLLGAHWLRGCKNSEVKRVGGWSNPRMGDHPRKLLRELPETKTVRAVREAQSGQYRATAEPVRGVTVWYQSHSAVWCECADEDVGLLKGGGL
ncbi:hypothetical protein L3X38_016615 [Prunus dulcis]|uniref:Uncharacterized protein n=1 Tax=Prunus dulcis TaxID=3755 RepID=A0AAD4Z9C3_PRUDU|nr:hypothetical protein L3X38_016615 [Prunus dulcis]